MKVLKRPACHRPNRPASHSGKRGPDTSSGYQALKKKLATEERKRNKAEEKKRNLEEKLKEEKEKREGAERARDELQESFLDAVDKAVKLRLARLGLLPPSL